ncbi:unnamed protein product, partial [Coregonus sp. 'balchen']
CCGSWCSCCLWCHTASELGQCVCLPLLDVFYSAPVPPGSMCDDCLVVTFCRLCAWCQMARELKTRRIFTKSN